MQQRLQIFMTAQTVPWMNDQKSYDVLRRMLLHVFMADKDMDHHLSEVVGAAKTAEKFKSKVAAHHIDVRARTRKLCCMG